MKEPFELSIDNPVLMGAKASLDTCLKAMVSKAVSTGSMEGTATLKISMEIEEGEWCLISNQVSIEELMGGEGG